MRFCRKEGIKVGFAEVQVPYYLEDKFRIFLKENIIAACQRTEEINSIDPNRYVHNKSYMGLFVIWPWAPKAYLFCQYYSIEMEM